MQASRSSPRPRPRASELSRDRLEIVSFAIWDSIRLAACLIVFDRFPSGLTVPHLRRRLPHLLPCNKTHGYSGCCKRLHHVARQRGGKLSVTHFIIRNYGISRLAVRSQSPCNISATPGARLHRILVEAGAHFASLEPVLVGRTEGAGVNPSIPRRQLPGAHALCRPPGCSRDAVACRACCGKVKGSPAPGVFPGTCRLEFWGGHEAGLIKGSRHEWRLLKP